MDNINQEVDGNVGRVSAAGRDININNITINNPQNVNTADVVSDSSNQQDASNPQSTSIQQGSTASQQSFSNQQEEDNKKDDRRLKEVEGKDYVKTGLVAVTAIAGTAIAGTVYAVTSLPNPELLLGGIRVYGLEITGLNATFAIAGTLYLASKALSEISGIIKLFKGDVVVQADHGCLRFRILTKGNQSKQALLNQLHSKELKQKLREITSKEVEVHLIEVGVMIATEEEFASLKKYMKHRLKSVDAKVEDNWKGIIEDFCCFKPIFQNKARYLMHEVTPDIEDDVIKCMKANLELVKSEDCPTSKLNNEVKLKGFFTEHSEFDSFSETFNLHPGVQEEVVELIELLKYMINEMVMIIILVKTEELLAINPKNFTGDCQWVHRNLAKLVKFFMFNKEFEVAFELFQWMIGLCNNIMDTKKIINMLCYILKLICIFCDFVHKSDRRACEGYAEQLCSKIRSCAESNFKNDWKFLVAVRSVVNWLKKYFYFIDTGRLWWVSLGPPPINLLLLQNYKIASKLVDVLLERLIHSLKIDCDYDLPDAYVHCTFETCISLVETSNQRFVERSVEVVGILISKRHIGQLPNKPYLRFKLFNYFDLLYKYVTLPHKFSKPEFRKKVLSLLIVLFKRSQLNTDNVLPRPVLNLFDYILLLFSRHPLPYSHISADKLAASGLYQIGCELLKDIELSETTENNFKAYENGKAIPLPPNIVSESAGKKKPSEILSKRENQMEMSSFATFPHVVKPPAYSQSALSSESKPKSTGMKKLSQNLPQLKTPEQSLLGFVSEFYSDPKGSESKPISTGMRKLPPKSPQLETPDQSQLGFESKFS